MLCMRVATVPVPLLGVVHFNLGGRLVCSVGVAVGVAAMGVAMPRVAENALKDDVEADSERSDEEHNPPIDVLHLAPRVLHDPQNRLVHKHCREHPDKKRAQKSTKDLDTFEPISAVWQGKDSGR